MATTALITVPETALDVTHHPSLPSIADIRHRMTWMKEFRCLLKEYVEEQMDPARHMYTFSDNAYAPIKTRSEIKEMLAQGQKPALNQDGIHNLMALYEADVDRQEREVLREDGHYTVKITLWLRYFGGRQVVGYGTCTTRESKYAYRWVGDRRLPKGIDKASLRQRESENRKTHEKFTLYRLENEDMADIENTIDQMALKRAKSSAVKSLPGVSEMFATVGDPEEEKREEDRERQEVLDGLKLSLSRMKAGPQAKAILAIFGQPLTRNDIPKQDLETLHVAAQRLAIATAAGINWQSETLEADLKRAMAASAAKAKEELFGDQGGSDPTAPAHYRVTPQGTVPVSGQPPVDIDPDTGEELAPEAGTPPAEEPPTTVDAKTSRVTGRGAARADAQQAQLGFTKEEAEESARLDREEEAERLKREQAAAEAAAADHGN